MNNSKVRGIVYPAVGAVIIAILAQITIPFPLVPNTAQPLALGLMATVFGKKYGTMATLVYVLMGAIGLPVFAGMSGGLGIILFGPTGGYIMFFPIMVFMIGLLIEKLPKHIASVIFANILMTMILITVGTWRMANVVDIPFTMALASGFMPFIVTNPVQAIMASLIGVRVRKSLNMGITVKSNLVEA